MAKKKKEEPIKQVSTFMQILPCALNEDEIKQRGRANLKYFAQYGVTFTKEPE